MGQTYQLLVKVDGRWLPLRDIVAHDHHAAFVEAMATLGPEHFDKPIRLEQVTDDSEEAPPAPPPPDLSR